MGRKNARAIVPGRRRTVQYPADNFPTCDVSGKRVYPDEYSAQRFLRSAQLVHGQSDKIERRFYHCDHCMGYHLTSAEEW